MKYHTVIAIALFALGGGVLIGAAAQTYDDRNLTLERDLARGQLQSETTVRKMFADMTVACFGQLKEAHK